jgi:hypothetical protein
VAWEKKRGRGFGTRVRGVFRSSIGDEDKLLRPEGGQLCYLDRDIQVYATIKYYKLVLDSGDIGYLNQTAELGVSKPSMF